MIAVVRIVLSLWAAAMLAAQQPVPLRADPMTGANVRRDCLHVRLVADLEPVVEGGRLTLRRAAVPSSLERQFARGKLAPLVTGAPRSQLDTWYEHACAVLPPGQRPCHLAQWLRLELPSADEAAQVFEALAGESSVDCVHYEPVAQPACLGGDPQPPTPAFWTQQLYHGPGPDGLGIRAAQGVLGARGRGVAIQMIEDDWILSHEDVSQLVAANFVGAVPAGTSGAAYHGLSGASILCADRNSFGLNGIADQAELRLLSQLHFGLANAIAVATVGSQPGDTITIILMFLLGQAGANDWVPVEYVQSTFDAVLTATANGRMVVAAAGNGFRSLDDPRHLRRFDRNYRDSGAIMVGGSDGASPTRASWCNYGSRIDGNGWGENVVTAGYGTLFFGNGDPRQAYTADGSGTSSATPQVAGVVAALQGAAKRQLGRLLTTAEIRATLLQHGVACTGSIGSRPNLLGSLQGLGMVDGLLPAGPDVAIGGSTSVAISGNGVGALLFASFATGDVDLGLNRHLHLDLGSTQSVGFFGFAGGQAIWPVVVPNDSSLHGINLYLQAGVLQAAGGIHVTNSAQLTVL